MTRLPWRCLRFPLHFALIMGYGHALETQCHCRRRDRARRSFPAGRGRNARRTSAQQPRRPPGLRRNTRTGLRPRNIGGNCLSLHAPRASGYLPVAPAHARRWRHHYLRFAFCGALGEWDRHRVLDKGIVRTLWLSADEVRTNVTRHRSPLLVQSMEDYLRGARYPLELVHSDASVLLAPYLLQN